MEYGFWQTSGCIEAPVTVSSVIGCACCQYNDAGCMTADNPTILCFELGCIACVFVYTDAISMGMIHIEGSLQIICVSV